MGYNYFICICRYIHTYASALQKPSHSLCGIVGFLRDTEDGAVELAGEDDLVVGTTAAILESSDRFATFRMSTAASLDANRTAIAERHISSQLVVGASRFRLVSHVYMYIYIYVYMYICVYIYS